MLGNSCSKLMGKRCTLLNDATVKCCISHILAVAYMLTFHAVFITQETLR